MFKRLLTYSLCLFVVSCSHQPEPDQPTAQQQPLFRIVPSSQSHILFNGQYSTAPIMGGGVAVGDINNDGLPDLYFAGDSTNALYLNKGGLVFEDITDKAGVKGDHWSHGTAMADLNNDGYLDILVARERNEPHSVFDENFKDTLNVYVFMNNGDLTFTDKARELGIITQGPLCHGTFLDINNDHYLDIYLNANYNSKLRSGALTNIEKKQVKDFYPDYLFLSDSGKSYSNVIKESGITFNTKHRYGFTPYATDINNDGWVDLYLNNDFDTPDNVYYNVGGKFKPAPYKTFMQTSMYTMGIDAADINNDGLVDFFTCDMRAQTNYRQKTSWWESPYDWSRLLSETEKQLGKQQVKNALQLNRGNGTFSQISELSGLDATEWSWAPLIADFDNDGWKDIFVSNGNIIDHAFCIDLAYEVDSMRMFDPNFSEAEYMEHIRVKKDNPWYINYIYKNNGDLSFTDMRKAWGMGTSVNTNGAAYADLDNDGDLDLVVNNNGSTSFIYENTLNTTEAQNYLRIVPTSPWHYPMQGTRVTLYYGDKTQINEMQPVKGLFSSSEQVIHFGLGDVEVVDSMMVTWPDGHRQMLYNVKANQVLAVTDSNSTEVPLPKLPKQQTLFSLADNTGIDFVHQEDKFIDFGVDPLLPRMYSKDGPVLAKGDLNGDGLEDLIIGSSVGSTSVCYLQQSNGKFKKKATAFTNDTQTEVGSIAIFDADGDGDNDVYVAAGGFEYKDGADELMHHLYLNDGKGNFTLAAGKIPDIKVSSKCVRPYDFDKDGDLDLVVAGRVTAQKYPVIPHSYLLRNDGGTFTDVTESDAAFLQNLGMVTDLVVTDFNGDGWDDLIAVGEYMPVTFIKNDNGKLVDATDDITCNEKTSGFWNVIKAGDFDNDGDPDYVLGNLGLNTRFHASQDGPLELYAYDFDHNGSTDLLSGFYEDGKLYPCKQLRTLKPRINGIAKKFYKTALYGHATIPEIYDSSVLAKAEHLVAYETGSCYLENLGNGQFRISRLPAEAQFAPIQGMVVEDVDGDGNLDVAMTGNFFYAEVERGRYDSFKGLIMLGDGKGGFKPMKLTDSGFVVDGDARDLIKLKVGESDMLIATQNDDSLLVYGLSRR